MNRRNFNQTLAALSVLPAMPAIAALPAVKPTPVKLDHHFEFELPGLKLPVETLNLGKFQTNIQPKFRAEMSEENCRFIKDYAVGKDFAFATVIYIPEKIVKKYISSFQSPITGQMVYSHIENKMKISCYKKLTGTVFSGSINKHENNNFIIVQCWVAKINPIYGIATSIVEMCPL